MLYGKVGPGTHPCHWCGKPVTWAVGRRGGGPGVLVTDHVNGDKHDNTLSNLVPSCQSCNVRRARANRIEAGEAVYVSPTGHRQRASERTCEQCGKTFLARAADIKGGDARFCSIACVAQRSLCQRWNIARGKPCVCGSHVAA